MELRFTTIDEDVLRVDIRERETAEETRAMAEAVFGERARRGLLRVLLTGRDSRPIFKVEEYGLSNLLGRMAAIPGLRVAAVSDAAELHAAHQYVALLAKQRGVAYGAFQREDEALAWLRAEGVTKSAAMTARRVLVVDDNTDAANSIAFLLREAGHVVEIAHDGVKALQAARSLRPEFVFLDLGLPGMDGFEVARALRREPSLQAVRIIAVTGYGSETDRRRAEEAGIDQHLVKPADPAFLESLLGPRHRP